MNAGSAWDSWSPSVKGILGAWLFIVAGLVLSAITLPSWFKDHQVLVAACFASVSALSAALIAYDGATSKTRLDQRVNEEKERERRGNLFLKAEHMARVLAEGLRAATAFTDFLDGDDEACVPESELGRATVARPSQLGELWDNLGAFPPEIVAEFRSIAVAFDQAEAYLRHPKTRNTPGSTWVDDAFISVRPLQKPYQAALHSAWVISSALAPLTADFAKPLSDDERMRHIFPPPDGGDD